MGACLSTKSKKKHHQPLPFVNQKGDKEAPCVIIEENFKIVDYTQELKGVTDVEEIRSYFISFQPTDIRCVKAKRESTQEHSHLIFAFNQFLHGEGIREIGLITDYSRYGFAISIGDMNQIKEICNLSVSTLEMLHFPKSDNQHNMTIADVVEWAFEHKDEEYKDPRDTPEFNMGKRMFQALVNKMTMQTKRFF